MNVSEARAVLEILLIMMVMNLASLPPGTSPYTTEQHPNAENTFRKLCKKHVVYILWGKPWKNEACLVVFEPSHELPQKLSMHTGVGR